MERTEERHKKEQGRMRARLPIILSVTVAVVAVVFAGAMLVQNRSLRQSKHSYTTTSGRASNEEIIEKVSQAYDAPNEKPSVAQVADKSKLAGQPFFQNAQKGDYILVYPHAKIALIYRLSTNKVINIGPISTQN